MLTLLFDIDDTLYDQQQPFTATYNEVFGNQYDLDVSELFKVSRKYSDEVFKKSQLGEISMEDMYAYRIQNAFRDFGIEVDRDTALKFQEVYALNQSKIFMTDTIKDMFDKIQGKVRLGIISNGPTLHQKNKAHNLGVNQWIPPKFIFASEELKSDKPEREIFDKVIAAMNLEPEQTYFIGDSFPNDVVGAHNAGLKTIWFNRRHHEIPSQPKPDLIVNSEEELSQAIQDLVEWSLPAD